MVGLVHDIAIFEHLINCNIMYKPYCCVTTPPTVYITLGKIRNDQHTFNGPLSGTTQVSRYQKGKPIWILLKQETECGSGISWAVCKSAPHSRQITTPVPTTHHSVFYRPDALPAAQTNSVNALKA